MNGGRSGIILLSGSLMDYFLLCVIESITRSKLPLLIMDSWFGLVAM
jgi:hypothetical protein